MLKINENEHFARNPMGLKIAVPWILYIYLFQVIPIFGQVELSSSFADNMVLQQDDSVPIWGTEMPMKGLGKSPVSGVAEFIKSSDIHPPNKEPLAVRYGFEDCFEGTLFDSVRLPVTISNRYLATKCYFMFRIEQDG